MADFPEVRVVAGSRLEYLDPLHAIAEEMAKVAGLDEEACFHFALAVREAATNAVTHGNGSDPGKQVTVVFTLEAGALTVSIRDEGAGFDFEHADDPRLPENRFKTSGRGLLLIRSFVDDVSYGHGSEQGTEIRMVKRLRG
ncbi:MAG: ATP-binding protein [Acidobacteriota bacterium]